ncbi:unnamed protein product, partial [Laminaria digitata]
NNRVQLFDAVTRKYLTSVGRRGQIRPGRMQGPEGVAFVDGRREMIVADTGNNRLQVFHVNELAAAPSAPTSHANTASSGTDGALHPGGTSVDSSSEDHQSHGCLLVFNGGENDGNLRKRVTAGESEAGEGPLSQPCDVAYWRARPNDDDTAVVLRAWTPDFPPWFRRCTSGSRSEAFLRGELLSPLLPPDVNPSPQTKSACGAYSGERKKSDRPSSERWRQKKVEVGRSREESGPGIDAGGGGDGDGDGEGPKAGAFVVRETGVPGKLQLLFVAKTKVQ